jgi:hypothetical protein
MAFKGYVLLWKLTYSNNTTEVCKFGELDQALRKAKACGLGVDYEPAKWGTYLESQQQNNTDLDLTIPE